MVFVFLCDISISRIPVPRPKSGVVIILVNRLGDAIVGRSLVLSIQSKSKQNEPFLVLGDHSWQVLKNNLYSQIPTRFIDEKRFRTSAAYRVRVSIWLRMRNFRTAICFMHHRLEMRDDALVYVSSGEEKIVAELPFLNLRWYPWLFEFYLNRMTKIVPALPPFGSPSKSVGAYCKYARKVPHAFERFQNFCEHLYPGTRLGVQPLVAPTERSMFTDQIVLLNPGAKHEARMWPLSEWVGLAHQIAKKGYTVCFIGGPAEKTLISDL
jgi:Glycosyltransferase family 9 (heptosyltransferase)